MSICSNLRAKRLDLDQLETFILVDCNFVHDSYILYLHDLVLIMAFCMCVEYSGMVGMVLLGVSSGMDHLRPNHLTIWGCGQRYKSSWR